MAIGSFLPLIGADPRNSPRGVFLVPVMCLWISGAEFAILSGSYNKPPGGKQAMGNVLVVRDDSEMGFEESMDKLFRDVLLKIFPAFLKPDFEYVLVDALQCATTDEALVQISLDPELIRTQGTGGYVSSTFDDDRFSRYVALAAKEFIAVFEQAGKEVPYGGLLGHLKCVFGSNVGRFFRVTAL